MNRDLIIQKYHDGELSETDLAELEDWLRADEKNRVDFLKEGTLRSEIIATLSSEEVDNKKTAVLRQQHRHKRHRTKRSVHNKIPIVLILSAAAALIIALLLPLLSKRPIAHDNSLTIQSISGTVKLLHMHEALNASNNQLYVIGDTLTTTVDGLATLTDHAQNTWQLSNDTAISYQKNNLLVKHGYLKASIHPQQNQNKIIVSTPYCSVRVVGTIFEVSHQGSISTISVERGEIHIEHINGRTMNLSANNTIQLNNNGFITPKDSNWATGFALINPSTRAPIPQFNPLVNGDVVSLSKLNIDTISFTVNLNPERKALIDRVDLYINNKMLKIFILSDEHWSKEDIAKITLHPLGHEFGDYTIRAVPYYDKKPGVPFTINIKITQ